MNTNPSLEDDKNADDIGEAIRENRALRKAKFYRLDIAKEDLNFEKFKFDDPKLLGRQILDATNSHPVEEHSVVAVLQNGDFEDIRLDEAYDLRGRGAEKVIIFRTDRSFKFKVDHKDLEWGKSCISGAVLKKLAALPSGYDLYLEIQGGKGHDRLIEDCDIIRLDEPGVERFISVLEETTEGLEALPSQDKEYLDAESLDYEVIENGGHTAIVLKNFELPAGKYDHQTASLMIILPTGYPDTRPDMFFTFPWLKLAATGRDARAASVAHVFNCVTWQRWSRHSNSWRPGVDGLHTMIARARCALAKGE